MNWSVRFFGLMLLASCIWVLTVPAAMADIAMDSPSHLIGIDSHMGAASLSDISTVVPLEPIDPAPEAESVNKIAEPGSIGLVALMALMGGGAMMMRRRLG